MSEVAAFLLCDFIGPKMLKLRVRRKAITLDDLPPNALRRKRDPQRRGGFSLGVDLGMARTGVALSKDFSVRLLTVSELQGQKLEVQLLKIAEQEEVDEFIIGLPKSFDEKETPQSNKVVVLQEDLQFEELRGNTLQLRLVRKPNP